MRKLSPIIHYSLCLVGIGIALYSLYVESMLVNIPGYTPACDVSAWAMSCSKVFNSKYARPLSNVGFVKRGHVLDLSLPYLALLYFVPLMFLPAISKQQPTSVKLFRATSYVAVCFNMYLAYILKFVLGEVCLVCVSNYIVNLGLVLTVDNIARTSGISENKIKKA
jgi:uncharacterized membrane protein